MKGILQNLTFSINTPSVDQVREADYCGIISGRKTDKVQDCHFKIFYGDLQTAPLIEQCPLNLECKVLHVLNLGTHAFVIGEVKGTCINEDCLVNGKPDIKKIRPIIFNLETQDYSAIGEVIAKAWSVGREIKV